MRISTCIALLAGITWTASATTITYIDSINNNIFASAQYSLTANNGKVITSSSFSDGNSTTSALEVTDTPNMRLPSAPDGILLAPGTLLTAAIYNLAYEFELTANRTKTDLGTPSRAQTDPVFDVTNQNFTIELVIRDIGGGLLQTIDVTSLSSLDLLPYLNDGGATQAALETNGVFLRTRLRADSATFTASITYDSVNNPDRNVKLDYQLKEHLGAISSLTITTTPEPGSYALVGLGLVGAGFFRRKRNR